MKNLKFSRLFAAMMFVACLMFVGCDPVTNEKITTVDNYIIVRPLEADEAIIGTWTDGGQKFEIQNNNFKNSYLYGSWQEAYTGNNLIINYTSTTSGYIYMKYTKAIMPDYSYSEEAPDVGKWYALAFKDLNITDTTSSVKIAGAWKDDAVNAFEKLEDAIKAFTVENGYFATFNDVNKEYFNFFPA